MTHAAAAHNRAVEIEATRKLPRLSISLDEARKLPEYSHTLPTPGANPAGFRWRRHHGAPNGFSAGGPWPHWLICEFGEPKPDPMRPGRSVVPIACYRVAIRVPAGIAA